MMIHDIHDGPTMIHDVSKMAPLSKPGTLYKQIVVVRFLRFYLQNLVQSSGTKNSEHCRVSEQSSEPPDLSYEEFAWRFRQPVNGTKSLRTGSREESQNKTVDLTPSNHHSVDSFELLTITMLLQTKRRDANPFHLPRYLIIIN